MLQRTYPPFVKQLFAPEQLGPTAAADLAFRHSAAGDDAEARDLDGDEHLDLALADLSISRLAQALGGAFDVQAELLDLAFLGSPRELFQGDARGDVPGRLRSPALGQLGECDLAGDLLGADDLEDVARLRDLAHAGHDNRRRWRRCRHALAAIVRQRPHAPVDVAAYEVVSDLQRSRLHKDRSDWAAPALEVSVDHGPQGVSIRVGLQLEDVR